MSAIFLPRRWRHQPQGAVEVDPRWDARVALILNRASVYDPASRQTFTGTGSTIYTPSGGVRSFSGSEFIDLGSNTVNGVDLDVLSGRPFSVVTRYRCRSGGTVVGRGFSSAIGRVFQIYGESGTHPRYYLRSGSQTGDTWWSTGNAWHTLTVAFDGTSAAAYGDRDRATSLSVGPYTSDQSAQRIIIGARTNGTGFFLAGEIEFVYFFPRAISRDEHLALEESPYQLFRAPSHRIWFDVGAGAGGTTYNESLTESATVGDSLDPLAAFFASYAESVTAGDSADNAQTHAAALSESVTPADSATSAQSHAEALAESVTADDSAAPAQTIPVAFSEDVTAGDALADEVVPAGSFNETIAESATAEDAYASTQAHVAALAEQISVGDGYAVTGGAEVVERRRGAPIGPPLRTWRYAARIGGRMVYADTRQALQAAIADFEVSVPSRAEKKAQKAGKVVVRRLPKVQVVEAPAEERIEVQAQAQAANDRIAAEYLSALQAQIAIRAAMERDDMEAMIALDFL